MRHRIMRIIIVLVFAMSGIAMNVSAEQMANSASNIIAEGTCGDNVTWTLNDEGKLSLQGFGRMSDYTYERTIPWYSYQSVI